GGPCTASVGREGHSNKQRWLVLVLVQTLPPGGTDEIRQFQGGYILCQDRRGGLLLSGPIEMGLPGQHELTGNDMKIDVVEPSTGKRLGKGVHKPQRATITFEADPGPDQLPQGILHGIEVRLNSALTFAISPSLSGEVHPAGKRRDDQTENSNDNEELQQ